MYMTSDNFNAVGSAAELQWVEVINQRKSVYRPSRLDGRPYNPPNISFIMKMVESFPSPSPRTPYNSLSFFRWLYFTFTIVNS